MLGTTLKGMEIDFKLLEIKEEMRPQELDLREFCLLTEYLKSKNIFKKIRDKEQSTIKKNRWNIPIEINQIPLC